MEFSIFNRNKGVKQNILQKKDELEMLIENTIENPAIPEETKLRIIVHGTSLVCALIAVQPLPFADLLILSPIQMLMVTGLSKVLGNPLGNNKVKEVIATIAGVAGWGILSQQIIVGLYKTVIPFLGGVTTIPLVYAATAAIGYTAIEILRARKNDQEISKEKIKKMRSELQDKYEKEAKQKDMTIKTIKNDLKKLMSQAEELKLYKEELAKNNNVLNKVKNELSKKKEELTKYQSEINNKVDWDEVNDILEDNDKFRNINNKLKKDLEVKLDEIKLLQDRLAKYEEKRVTVIKDRLHKCYPNIKFNKTVYKYLLKLSYNELHLFEKEIAKLQHNSIDDIIIRRKIKGANDVFEIDYDGGGRIYFTRNGNMTIVHRIGDKNTQDKDINWIREKL